MTISQRFYAALLFCLLSSGALANECYVIGDTSKNNPSKPPGSQQNPYGSLAAVEADAGCDMIVVVYSSVALDGGISLQDGQELIGQKGPMQALPIIANTSAATNGGHGVRLAANNSISSLHITDTEHSGVYGADVGQLSIHNSRITRFALSEELMSLPAPLSAGMETSGGIEIRSTADVKIDLSYTEIGEADGTSIQIFVLGGRADIVIEDVSVRDQGHVDGANFSNGIKVLSLGDSSVDLQLADTSISNIGEGLSNSDGALLLALERSAMTARVDGYRYDNPDGDGLPALSAAIEVGNVLGTGSSFEGSIKNSQIYDAPQLGIIIVDQLGGGNSNSLNVEVVDNEIVNSGSGIALAVGGFGGPSFGTDIVTIRNNLIVDPRNDGIIFSNGFNPQTLVHMLIENNTVINAPFGLFFGQGLGASVASLNLDAGLGGLGGKGKNRIIGSQVADVYVQTFDCCGFPPTPPFAVDAANNWWGSHAGPTTVIEQGGATVDVTPFLTEDPGDD